MILYPCCELKTASGVILPTSVVKSVTSTYRHTLGYVWRSSHYDVPVGSFVFVNDEADGLFLDHRDVETLPENMELRIYGKEPDWPVENCITIYDGDGFDLELEESREFFFNMRKPETESV